ncbi:hypothetical protein AAEH73_15800, partial [Shewanella algae]|uniref:hypothetical protein n=1 Tax=Shewanella algae TaxID=38313 RepID=UPI00313F21DE
WKPFRLFPATDTASRKCSSIRISYLGCEVLNLGVFPAKNEYLEQIGSKVKQQGFEVILADWVQTTKDYGNYYNPKQL